MHAFSSSRVALKAIDCQDEIQPPRARILNKSPAKSTQCIWSGEESSLLQGATQVPVVHSVGFGYKDVDEWLQVALGEKPGYQRIYRYGHY